MILKTRAVVAYRRMQSDRKFARIRDFCFGWASKYRGRGAVAITKGDAQKGCATDLGRIPFPITRYLESTAFPITRSAYPSLGLSPARFGVRRSNLNRNTNLATPLPDRSTPFRVIHKALELASCYQVQPIVLLESERRAIGDGTACYQILSTGCESPDFRDFPTSNAPLTL